MPGSAATDSLSAPASADALRAAILQRYDGLSQRLQQIARYVLDAPNDFALDTLAVLAERSGVQPSAIVRFAQAFGFEGASQMQRLFRDGLLAGQASGGYRERALSFREAAGERGGGELLGEFVEGDILALQALERSVGDADLAAAVRLVEACDTVFVAGFRRAFAVASYLAYSLQQSGKRTVFVDGVGGMAQPQMQTIAPRDLLIAVSYAPYADETGRAVEAASAIGAKVLAISDSLVSPIARSAQLTLQVREAEVRGFRSLSASMCLAQALAVGFAFEVARKTERRARRQGGERTDADG
jgi:DNA-binding MurR/RpiR family transcriptional regulator